ncbi:MAG: DUF4956 domain-containing protein [Bacteroidales bacterium]|nr:DUF4956 domain-containing protein [Bacteroidales bacterium]
MLDLEIFGIDIIKLDDFLELVIRFAINLLVMTIVVRYIYYPTTRRKDYLTTYLLIGITIFLLCFLLENVKLQLGFALGLFAIFGIIRYRTNPIPIKEMTYLFIIIGVAVINALANKKVSYAELIFSNIIIIFITYGLEHIWLLKHESRKTILYEKIELIKPENYNKLKLDLEYRTGLKINRIEIGNVDFLKDVARIRIYYFEQDNGINTTNEDEIPANDDE